MFGEELEKHRFLGQDIHRALRKIRSHLICYASVLMVLLVYHSFSFSGIKLERLLEVADQQGNSTILPLVLFALPALAILVVTVVYAIGSFLRLGDLMKSVETHIPKNHRNERIQSMVKVAKRIRALLAASVLVLFVSSLGYGLQDLYRHIVSALEIALALSVFLAIILDCRRLKRFDQEPPKASNKRSRP